MNAKSYCIVCGARGRETVMNDMPMLLCDSCGLFWRADFDLPENHYESRSFELENKDKIEARYANSAGRIETLKKYADLNNLCDIGCGEGIFLKALKDAGYKNIIGLEPSVGVHNFAALNDLEIIEGKIEGLSGSFFRDNGIHTVTMFHVVEHLKDPGGTLKTIHGSLSKGDKVIIETPDTGSYILRKKNYKHELIYPEHLHYFNKSNLRKLLGKNGFTTVASGNRDFNDRNLGIKESLARLGLADIAGGDGEAESEPGRKNTRVPGKRDGVLRRAARGLLSAAVRALGRGNYLWVVAERN